MHMAAVRTVLVVVVGSALALSTSPASGRKPTGTTCPPSAVWTDAFDKPSKHAWDLFLELNHPARDKTVARGEPDCTKQIGAPGGTAVWETWRNAATEVFLDDGREPPTWEDTSLPDAKPGSAPAAADAAGKPIVSFHGLRRATKANAAGFKAFFSPDGVFNNAGGFGETRMNKATYEFVRDACLFSIQGQQRYAKAIKEGKKPAIKLPVESREVKAAWLDLAKENIPVAKWNTYYTADYEGRKYGLVALHIITKEIPNWFWASFHHKDAPKNEFETKDEHGQPPELAGTVWENYVLGGVQNDFVHPDGHATVLSDHYIEFGFQRSSCITCHATATISPTLSMPNAQLKAICAMTPNVPDLEVDPATCRNVIGNDSFKPGTDELLLERGAPDPRWFAKDGKPYYLQTDFLWSIPFRAKKEAGNPPSRCIW